jgi:hypothetical protein
VLPVAPKNLELPRNVLLPRELLVPDVLPVAPKNLELPRNVLLPRNPMLPKRDLVLKNLLVRDILKELLLVNPNYKLIF